VNGFVPAYVRLTAEPVARGFEFLANHPLQSTDYRFTALEPIRHCLIKYGR
jgi:hypothetical protein